MEIALADRVRIRKLRHAERMTADLRASDAAAEDCLGGRARAACDELIAAAQSARPDYASSPRAAAEHDLRLALTDAIRMVRAVAGARAVQNEELVEPERIDAAEAIVGTPSPVRARSGPALQAAAERFRNDALAAQYDAAAAIVDGPIALYATALETGDADVEELDAAQHRLVKARAEADRWLRAGRAYVTYKVEAFPTSGVAVDEVFPVPDIGDPFAENSSLDDVGVPEPEDEEAQDEPDDEAGDIA
jgi:hypothetical protein